MDLYPPPAACDIVNATLGCYHVRIGTLCGRKAAERAVELMQAVFTGILDVPCEITEPAAVDYMPEPSRAATSPPYGVYLLILLSLVFVP